MRTKTMIALKDAAEVYLETRPDHPNGFCLWLGFRWDEDSDPQMSLDLAYKTVSPYFQRYADVEETFQRTWVDVIGGPTPKRVKFVKWLLDEVTAELNLVSEEV